MSGHVPHQDFEFISNDPDENADNFNPRWARLRELTTDEERYNAVRESWGNPDIPDPKINLTFRHVKTHPAAGDKENISSPMLPHKNRRQRLVSRRRSRSCTRPYEELMSGLEKNYKYECSQLMYKQNAEIQELLQIQFMQIQCLGAQNFGAVKNHLQFQQTQEVMHLLSNHFEEMRNFNRKKYENIDTCKRYLEEVQAFFTFYQKINDDEVTLQMTDEQYEHTVETEKMYELYHKFYM